MITVLPCVDHLIGYKCLRYLLNLEEKGQIHIPYVITTENNKKGWWPSVNSLNLAKDILLFEDLRDLTNLERPDYLLLLSWKHILSDEWIAFPKMQTINLHYSLLPKNKGSYPVNWSIINNESFTGISYHLVNQNIDSGGLLIQRKIKISLKETTFSLLQKLDSWAYLCFIELMDKICSGQELIIITNNNMEGSSHSRRDFDKIKKLQLTEKGSFLDFFNLLRGLSFQKDKPICYIEDENSGKKYGISINIKELE